MTFYALYYTGTRFNNQESMILTTSASLDAIENIKKRYEKVFENIEIKTFDFITHMFDGNSIVKRAEPLTIYCASDLYKVPTLREDPVYNWHELSSLFPEITTLHSLPEDSSISIKMIHNDMFTVWMDDAPFMILQHVDSDLNRYITDISIYKKALSYLWGLTECQEYLDPNKPCLALTNFGNTTIASFKEES
jgi:hypothetical protein